MENHQYTTMASSSSPTATPTPTTFIQAEANTFRDLVQKLTGCTGDTDRLPGKLSSKPSVPFPGCDSTTPRRSRKQHPMRKLEIELGLTTTSSHGSNSSPTQCCSPGQVCPLDAASPVTPLLSREPLFYSSSGTVSPSSPVVSVPEEEKAIAEKGFYLHPSPLNTSRGSQPPELLTLFPLSSSSQDKRE
ncbi:MPK3/6-targeted VQP 2 [Hibiscus trionum]|uniref:MPK3/6-targeted VQP 2 n=1 Tax=Hibiscus trionum TaxID=183268 RepID=A0A9W7M6F8_HIBTR|nr:MPK3/6-targeted VQP 2 [Hibiscus trionum]